MKKTKKKYSILFVFVVMNAFSQINSPNGTNYFTYTGNADVNLRCTDRGNGGRAIVHGSNNTLTLNYNSDFTGGTRIGNDVFFKDGGSSYILSGNLGIGTTAPAAKLDIVGDIYIDNLDWSTDNALRIREGSSNSYGAFFKYGLNDLLTIGTRHIDSDYVAFQISRGSTNVTFNGAVGIGTTIPDSKLTVNGTIHATEVKVTQTVPADYVFQKYYTGKSELKPDYTLLTLSEIEKFTKENQHLPNVPSAKEIKENGLLLGEMSNILLQKIEELTLYSIEQQKIIVKQATAIEKLEKENESFQNVEERLSKMEQELKAKK